VKITNHIIMWIADDTQISDIGIKELYADFAESEYRRDGKSPDSSSRRQIRRDATGSSPPLPPFHSHSRVNF